ncbi:hypothetical protein [Flavobacterium foetidum]|uniref:hypothetical protein n=1 Tax=Flavobacterium foetidum TaxID=2026681 RepID=UPI0010757C1F|nr:hypothetical protein [Flavobacterium foetidum]KAF2516655.1 hypothetical protein E0W73_06080 [Flavobacterium foetidum]
MSKKKQINLIRYYFSAACFLALFGCKTANQDITKHNYVVGESNYGDLLYNDLIDVSIDILGNVTYNDFSKLRSIKLKKEIRAVRNVSIKNLIVSCKADQNFEIFYFFEKIKNPIDTIVHEKLVKNDSINRIFVFEKQKGAKKIICITRALTYSVNNLKRASENIKKVYLDSTNLNKLSYMKMFNHYTQEPNKNFLQGREKIKTAPIKDSRKLMMKEPLYFTLNSFMNGNEEYDLLIKGYENEKNHYDATVESSLSKNEVKKNGDVYNEIAKIARDNQIIILNEDHFYPRHRLFAMLLLDVLKQNGFTSISLETFVPNEEGDSTIVPNSNNGFYIKDPYFGHFIRKANAMGFNLLGHENYESSIDREAGQAKNIMKLLERDPKAKIFIYVGHGHLEKEGKRRAMASYLKEYSNIDPVTINQETVMTKTKEELVLLPKSVFVKDTLMKSSADYFLVNNLSANLESVYPNDVFRKAILKNEKFRFFKNQELLVDVFQLEEYDKTKNADLLVPIESILAVPKGDEIEINLPVGNYYVSVKSNNGEVFKFDDFINK